MNIRTFQIIVPAIAIIYLFWQIRNIYNYKTKWKAIWPGIILAITISFLAIFPDQITNWLAKTLDFKSNINAIIFVLLGVLFVAVIILYDLYKKQQKNITKLTIELSILMSEKEGIKE
ncbi:MAG: DUF2304 domain-containing protein [Flavobacteriaceae bacterium]